MIKYLIIILNGSIIMSNEEVLTRIKEHRISFGTITKRKVNWMGSGFRGKYI